jgi:hypothetical protein
MLSSIIRSKHVLKTMPLIPRRLRGRIAQLVNMHRLLMCFFLVGYIVVLVSFTIQLIQVSNVFVSVIFLLGAVFVFMGVSIEVQLLEQIQRTVSGLLPICSVCKKVRNPERDTADPTAWEDIEEYIATRVHVGLTHGYCPACHAKIMQDMGAAGTRAAESRSPSRGVAAS